MVLFLLLLLPFFDVSSSAAAILSAAAHADSSFLHLSPGLINFSIFANSFLTVGTPILDVQGGLFFPILSSHSFNTSANSPSFNTTRPFGFSLGFYLVSSHNSNAEFGYLTPCSLYRCNTVCAGSLGNVSSSQPILLIGALKNDQHVSPEQTVDGISAPVWITNLNSPIGYVDEAYLMVVADSKGRRELQLRDGENVVWQVPNVGDSSWRCRTMEIFSSTAHPTDHTQCGKAQRIQTFLLKGKAFCGTQAAGNSFLGSVASTLRFISSN